MPTDTNSIKLLQELHPVCRNKAIDAYNRACALTPKGVHPVIDSTLRTWKEQQAEYDKGRKTPGEIVSDAMPGYSEHNYGLALDWHLQINGKDSWTQDANWMTVVNIFKQHGFFWGADFTGKFKDPDHFEWCVLSVFELRRRYLKKDFLPGTEYVRI